MERRGGQTPMKRTSTEEGFGGGPDSKRPCLAGASLPTAAPPDVDVLIGRAHQAALEGGHTTSAPTTDHHGQKSEGGQLFAFSNNDARKSAATRTTVASVTNKEVNLGDHGLLASSAMMTFTGGSNFHALTSSSHAVGVGANDQSGNTNDERIETETKALCPPSQIAHDESVISRTRPAELKPTDGANDDGTQRTLPAFKGNSGSGGESSTLLLPGTLSYMVGPDDKIPGFDFDDCCIDRDVRFMRTTNVTLVDRSFHVVAVGGVLVWLALTAVVYRITPPEHFVRLPLFERCTAALGGALQIGSILSKVGPLLVKRGGRSMFSGIMVGAVVVQLVAAATNLFMVVTAVPVMADPVTGANVYLLRWCEWTPLAFLMTFFTEGVHVPEDDHHLHEGGSGRGEPKNDAKEEGGGIYRLWKVVKYPSLIGLSQGSSTLMGLLFPFCPSPISWVCCMVVSCLLFLIIFPRWYYKRKSYLQMNRGINGDEMELHDRARLSYRLLTLCVIMWTLLVTSYFFGAFAPRLAAENSFLQHPSLPLVCDMVLDVVTKAFYMDVIVEAHFSIFDDAARSARRLEELRRMMSAVWECSSDVIAISVRAGMDGAVTTMLSPSFRKIECGGGGVGGGGFDAWNDGAFETKPVVFKMKAVDFGVGATTDGHGDSRQDGTMDVPPKAPACKCMGTTDHGRCMCSRCQQGEATNAGSAAQPSLASMRDLMIKAWAARGSERLLLHDIRLRDGSSMRCEAMSTKLGDNALVVVIRDISERFRRFEAEKDALSQSIAREKDAEANRFTRHEVKNRLLAAIGLCDGLREALVERQEVAVGGERATNGQDTAGRPLARDGQVDSLRRYIADLDSTLREVLDTVLAEAMSKDVIHGVYEPKVERVDLKSFLFGGEGKHEIKRFPVVLDTPVFPVFMLDPQLLKYIHRNALSNACKYGKRGGVVITEIHFDGDRNEIRIDVINLPGEDHETLLKLGDYAEKVVFSPGKRLHRDISEVSHSSGDGAWISRKCAKSLGGDCSIRFEKGRTVFSLWCPAKPFDVMLKLFPGSIGDPSNFRLPDDTWGVAIDDSKVQRKLMQRFFSVAGIPEQRQVVLGKNASEIWSFNDRITELIKNNPRSYFLVIADENLDIMDDNDCRTISGSLCIQKLRQRLDESHENMLLALVRSANDSAADIAIYNSRAHGFLCKAPIQRDKVMETLALHWARRFSGHVLMSPKSPDVLVPLPCFDTDTDTDTNVTTAARLMQTVEVIDALCIHNESPSAIRWPVIREQLVVLTDDLKRLEKSQCLADVVGAIDRIDGQSTPEAFSSQWAIIRAQILRII